MGPVQHSAGATARVAVSRSGTPGSPTQMRRQRSSKLVHVTACALCLQTMVKRHCFAAPQPPGGLEARSAALRRSDPRARGSATMEQSLVPCAGCAGTAPLAARWSRGACRRASETFSQICLLTVFALDRPPNPEMQFLYLTTCILLASCARGVVPDTRDTSLRDPELGRRLPPRRWQ